MNETNSNRKLTAAVIGAGPAGLSAAIALCRLGFNVTVLEMKKEILPRVCGSYLNPEAVRHLDWLDIQLDPQNDSSAQVKKNQIFIGENSFDVDSSLGMGIPRENLERKLAERVLHLGGNLRWGQHAIKHEFDQKQKKWILERRDISSGHNQSLKNEFDLVIKAGGRFSTVPKLEKEKGGWIGFNAMFSHVDQSPGEQSLHFLKGRYVGVLTYGDGHSNVCGLVYKRKGEPIQFESEFNRTLSQMPFLKNILCEAKLETPWRGVGSLPFSKSMRSSSGPLYVGDAAAVGDPFMGEGIGRALAAGPMIFSIIKEYGLEVVADPASLKSIYEQKWRRCYSSRLYLGTLFRSLLRSSVGLRGVGYFLKRWPQLIQTITSVIHVGYNATSNPHVAPNS